MKSQRKNNWVNTSQVVGTGSGWSWEAVGRRYSPAHVSTAACSAALSVHSLRPGTHGGQAPLALQHTHSTIHFHHHHHYYYYYLKGKGRPHSIIECRVPELIPVLGSHLQVAWVINLAVGCHYFPPGLQLPPQLLRGLLPILLLGEQRHNGCEQFA